MVDGTIRNFCSYECVLTYRVTTDAFSPERGCLLFSLTMVHFPFVLEQQSGQNSKPDPVNGLSAHNGPRQASPANAVPPVSQDASSVPHQGHHPNHTSVPALVPSYLAPSGQAQAKAPAEGGAGDPSKLTCHQCSKQFGAKPVLFCHQVRKR